MTSHRKQRLLRVLELIGSRRIHTQEELVEALHADGWAVTQSSVSRDIAALGLVKVDGAYERAPAAESRPEHPDETRIREGVLSVEPAGDALVVIRTPPGEANRVGVALDRLAWSEVVGTLAGDDTIFVAVRHAPGQAALVRRLRRLTPTA